MISHNIEWAREGFLKLDRLIAPLGIEATTSKSIECFHRIYRLCSEKSLESDSCYR